MENAQFKAFLELPVSGPVLMYNLLKYQDKVADSEFSGAEIYRQYLKAANPFFVQAQAKLIFKGRPVFTLIGPQEKHYWDEILIVEYPSKAAFIAMVTAEDYPAKIREEALLDSRLIFCQTK